jgi:hypothetical protein
VAIIALKNLSRTEARGAWKDEDSSNKIIMAGIGSRAGFQSTGVLFKILLGVNIAWTFSPFIPARDNFRNKCEFGSKVAPRSSLPRSRLLGKPDRTRDHHLPPSRK